MLKSACSSCPEFTEQIRNVPGFQVSIASVARVTGKKQYGGLRVMTFYKIRVFKVDNGNESRYLKGICCALTEQESLERNLTGETSLHSWKYACGTCTSCSQVWDHITLSAPGFGG